MKPSACRGDIGAPHGGLWGRAFQARGSAGLRPQGRNMLGGLRPDKEAKPQKWKGVAGAT